MPHLWQNIIRILAALVFLQLGFLIKKRCHLSETAVWLLMLAMIYVILLNPRTENNDYMMLIPVLSYFFIGNLTHQRFYHLGFIVFIFAGLSGSYYISSLLSGHRNWSAPLLGLLLMIYLFHSLPGKERLSIKHETMIV